MATGICPCCTPGPGNPGVCCDPAAVSPSVSIWSPLCSSAARRFTDRRVQPIWLSPVCRRTVAEVVESRNTAMPPVLPLTVPIRLRFGRSGADGGGGGGGGDATGALTTTGAGGRREEENKGRSRVAVSAPSGIDQSGLTSGFTAAPGKIMARRVTSKGPRSVACWGLADVAASTATVTQSRTAKRCRSVRARGSSRITLPTSRPRTPGQRPPFAHKHLRHLRRAQFPHPVPPSR